MLSITTHREGLLWGGPLPCLHTAPTYNHCDVVQHVIFDRFGLAQPHECSSKTTTCHANSTVCASGLQQHLICTEDVTTVRRTLQREQMCSRDTIASSTWSDLIDFYIFYSLLAASICCHRGRHRCDTVIHACLLTCTRSVFESRLELLRPSVRGTPSYRY